MLRPIPLPISVDFVEKNGAIASSATSGDMPFPSSSTTTQT